MNATCGNVPELIIALFALHKNKMEILKWSLLGSILSNLLLVLGSSLLFGGIVNIGKERPLDKVSVKVHIQAVTITYVTVLTFCDRSILTETSRCKHRPSVVGCSLSYCYPSV